MLSQKEEDWCRYRDKKDAKVVTINMCSLLQSVTHKERKAQGHIFLKHSARAYPLFFDEPPISREPPCPGSITTMLLAMTFSFENPPYQRGKESEGEILRRFHAVVKPLGVVVRGSEGRPDNPLPLRNRAKSS